MFQKSWNYIKYNKKKLASMWLPGVEIEGTFRTLNSTNTCFMPHTYWEYCFTVNMQQFDEVLPPTYFSFDLGH